MQESSFNTLVALTALLITLNLKAQVEPPTIMPGFSPTYSAKLGVTGINARLYYAMDHQYCYGPEISYFKKSNEDGETSLFEANANLHYIIEIGKGFGFYPLTGINFSVESEIDYQEPKEKHTENEFGVNVGAGIHFATGRFIFFTEYKYVISKLEDHFLSIGALINFSLKKTNQQKHL